MSVNNVSSINMQKSDYEKTVVAKLDDAQEKMFSGIIESEDDLNNKLYQEPELEDKNEGILDYLKSGLKTIDKYTFDIIKSPFKKLSKKIDEKYAGSKLWEITKGLGDVADFMLSTEGLLVMGATALTLKGIMKGASKIGGAKGKLFAHQFIKTGFIGYGLIETGHGLLGAVTSDTPEEARQAGEQIGTGALFIAGGYKMKSNVNAKGGKEIKAPESRLAFKANTPYAEVKTKVTTLFDKLYDDLGIPKEARPKLEIIDNIKYKSKAEIEEMVLEKINGNKWISEEKLDKIKIFEESDNPMEMTVEEIKAKIQKAVNGTPDAKIYDFEYDAMLCDANTRSGGGYSGKKEHTLTVNINTLRNGTFKSIEEIIVHEVEHSRNAILRHRLSKEDSSKIIKELLINRIMNGEPERILVKGTFVGAEMMEPPKMSAKMKAEFVKFAKEKLYTDEAKNYIGDLSQIESQQYRSNPTEKSAKYEEAIRHFSEIQSWIENIINENPDFVEQYKGEKEKAINMLTKYVQSHLVRYYNFSDTRIDALKNVEFPELTPEEYSEAIRSLEGMVETIEGNAGNQGFNNIFGSKIRYNQYQFSYEEVLARNTAAEYELTKLKAEPETAKTKARIEDLEFQLKYNDIGSKFYRLYMESLNHPNDTKLKADLLELKKEFKNLEKQKETSDLDYIMDFQIPYISGMIGDAQWYRWFN